MVDNQSRKVRGQRDDMKPKKPIAHLGFFTVNLESTHEQIKQFSYIIINQKDRNIKQEFHFNNIYNVTQQNEFLQNSFLTIKTYLKENNDLKPIPIFYGTKAVSSFLYHFQTQELTPFKPIMKNCIELLDFIPTNLQYEHFDQLNANCPFIQYQNINEMKKVQILSKKDQHYIKFILFMNSNKINFTFECKKDGNPENAKILAKSVGMIKRRINKVFKKQQMPIKVDNNRGMIKQDDISSLDSDDFSNVSKDQEADNDLKLAIKLSLQENSRNSEAMEKYNKQNTDEFQQMNAIKQKQQNNNFQSGNNSFLNEICTILSPNINGNNNPINNNNNLNNNQNDYQQNKQNIFSNQQNQNQNNMQGYFYNQPNNPIINNFNNQINKNQQNNNNMNYNQNNMNNNINNINNISNNVNNNMNNFKNNNNNMNNIKNDNSNNMNKNNNKSNNNNNNMNSNSFNNNNNNMFQNNNNNIKNNSMNINSNNNMYNENNNSNMIYDQFQQQQNYFSDQLNQYANQQKKAQVIFKEGQQERRKRFEEMQKKQLEIFQQSEEQMLKQFMEKQSQELLQYQQSIQDQQQMFGGQIRQFNQK